LLPLSDLTKVFTPFLIPFFTIFSAKKIVSKMDEDSTLTQLCGAWTNIALGGEKAHDAYYAFQELMDKTQTSPFLLNGAAAAHIAQQKWEEADGAVKEATEKDINCPETLINQIMVIN
jgi:coatomer protein complex subunit epsilon